MPSKVQVPSIGMIALGVFIAAFVLLMLAGHSFVAGLLFALVLTTGVAVFFVMPDGPSSSGAGTAPPHGVAEPPASASSSIPGADAPPAGRAEPPRLDAPRGGEADDLKQIKGIGPKVEEALNGLGVHHLDQIAAWGPADVAWMDENLGDFRGRASRDDWVGQARTLIGDGGKLPANAGGDGNE